ncbi:Fic family protein [Candidatus Margulisiibacteriota bacterium]
MPYTRFTKRLDQISIKIINKIAKIDELKGEWSSGVALHPQILGRLKKSVLVTSTGASTRIEGAKLSDEQIEKMMRGISIQKFSSRDQQEVKGYYELLQNIFDSWKKITFSENSIKHLHKELLKYVEKDKRHLGEYKKGENKVIMVNEEGQSVGILFETTPPYLTPKYMQELVDWTKKEIVNDIYHPLLIIGNFIVEFLQIHPFLDGNGRISRILTNLLMLKCGYLFVPYVSQEKIIEDSKPDYYMALRKSQKTFGKKKEDISVWIDFFLMVAHKQAIIAKELFQKDNIENILSPKQLLIWNYLQSVSEAAPSEIAKKTKVARPTVNQSIQKLLSLKKIEQLGEGRATRYRKI